MGNSSYGSGAITDGHYHLCVNITNFDEYNSPPVEMHVTINGEVRRNRFGTIIVQVHNMADINILNDQVMGPKELVQGFRIPPEVESPQFQSSIQAAVASDNQAQQAQTKTCVRRVLQLSLSENFAYDNRNADVLKENDYADSRKQKRPMPSSPAARKKLYSDTTTTATLQNDKTNKSVSSVNENDAFPVGVIDGGVIDNDTIDVHEKRASG